MNWVIREVEEFTTWLLINHARHMQTVRAYLARQERRRMEDEYNHVHDRLRRRRRVEQAQVRARAEETQALIAEHRQWNAARQSFGGTGGVRHFG